MFGIPTVSKPCRSVVHEEKFGDGSFPYSKPWALKVGLNVLFYCTNASFINLLEGVHELWEKPNSK